MCEYNPKEVSVQYRKMMMMIDDLYKNPIGSNALWDRHNSFSWMNQTLGVSLIGFSIHLVDTSYYPNGSTPIKLPPSPVQQTIHIQLA